MKNNNEIPGFLEVNIDVPQHEKTVTPFFIISINVSTQTLTDGICLVFAGGMKLVAENKFNTEIATLNL